MLTGVGAATVRKYSIEQRCRFRFHPQSQYASYYSQCSTSGEQLIGSMSAQVYHTLVVYNGQSDAHYGVITQPPPLNDSSAQCVYPCFISTLNGLIDFHDHKVVLNRIHYSFWLTTYSCPKSCRHQMQMIPERV